MTSRTVKMDENVMRFNQVKLPGKALNGEPAGIQRRAALGELGNRVKNPNASVVDGKKQALGDLKHLAPNLKEIKSRVDTHWKKDVSAAAHKAPVTRSAAQSAVPVAAVAPQPRLVRTRTLQTAQPEQAQRITRVAVRPEAAAVAPAAGVAQVRRQESNLTRRSLTKLRAAIKRDTQQQKQPANKPSSSGESTTSSQESLDVVRGRIVAPALANELQSTQQAHSTIALADVENVDANDDNVLILVAEYVNDIYHYMYQLERSQPIRENHLQGQLEVTHKMRGVLIDWLNEVHLQFTLVQETFFMAVAIIDRYLQVVKTTSRQNLQLVGITALFMASKYEELYPPEIRDFVYITDDTYDKRQILEMERHMFKKLEFQMGRPLAIHFLRRFAKAAHSGQFNDNTYLMSKYFIELATVDYSMAHFMPSEVAAASLLLALRLMDATGDNGANVWNATIKYYTTYGERHLQPIVQKLGLVVREAPGSKLRAVYNKYKHPKMGQISEHATLLDRDAFSRAAGLAAEAPVGKTAAPASADAGRLRR